MRPLAVSLALLGSSVALGGTALLAAPARAVSSCATPTVLLFGSYPAEVAGNLALLKQDANQPTTLDGHDFYAGTLEGRHVVIAIAGPSPALASSVTTMAVQHYGCVSAVVYSGTAGGAAPADLGDVAVASRWTDDEGKTYRPINAHALEVARATSPAAIAEFGTLAAIEDGPCGCAVSQVSAVSILRTPTDIVGGNGVSYGGDSDTCSANGGLLGGCNPCPPSSQANGIRQVVVLAGATPEQVSMAAHAGVLTDAAGSVLETGVDAVPPAALAPGGNVVGNSSTPYLVDDQQTTGAMQAADALGIPFIAFRGVSDTASVGDLWPSEYAVYQGLAADNSGIAARKWIGAWDGLSVGAAQPVAVTAQKLPVAKQPAVTQRPVKKAAEVRRAVRQAARAGTVHAPARSLAYTGAGDPLPLTACILLGGGALAARRRSGRHGTG